jgi:3(or 17)beta-hydroxysteroid dehydrogenase
LGDASSDREGSLMGRIDGRVCIVTGAADGLGKADAVVLAREGGRVVLTDVQEEGERTAQQIDGEAIFVHQDVRDEDRWRALIGMVMDRFGRLDVLVNNAGVIRVADIETVTLEDWRFVNAVNVEGTFLGCKHAIPAMRAGVGGSIINVSSTAAILGFAGAPAYTASKGAVQALTRSIAVHCMSRGERIRCNAIYPHLAESPMSRAHGGTTALASADGVANAVLFLASDESSDLNGTFLNLDRGTSCLVGELPLVSDPATTARESRG